MARISDYPQQEGSLDGGRILVATETSVGSGVFENARVPLTQFGVQGPIGPPGPQGPPGDQGGLGIQGVQGSAGPAGPQGPAGATGATGATGAAGATGATGAAGADATAPVESRIYDSIAVDYFDYPVGGSPTLNGGIGWSGTGASSGSAIVTRTAAGGQSEKRLTLSSGQVGRTFAWGNKWNGLLLGVAVRTSNGANFTGNFHMGVCSGTTNMAGSGTCDNFFGVCGSLAATITWTRTVGTQMTYFLASAGLHCTRRGTTTTTRAGSLVNLPVADTEGFLSYWLLFLDRSAFTGVGAFTTTSTARYQSTTTRDMYAGKLGLVTNVLRSVDFATIAATSNTPAGYAFDETTGALDTMNVWWDASQTLDIAAMAAVRLY